MPNTSREDQLIQRQHEIWSEMEQLLQTTRDEDRDFSDEERQTWDRAESDLERTSQDIERVQRHNDRDQPSRGGGLAGSGVTEPTESSRGADESRYEEAFYKAMRKGFTQLNTEERELLQRAAPQGTPDADGGYTIPQGFRQYLQEKMLAYGGIMNIAQNITTDAGNKLPWPVVLSGGMTSKGSLLGENTAMSDQGIEFDQKSLDSFTYVSGMIPVSYQLLQDSAFDMAQYISGVAGERIGRKLAEHLAVGTDSSQPQGVSQTTNTVTAAGTSAITYADMLDLEHAVDPAYRNTEGVRYLMSDGVLRELRSITDDQGRPLWVPVPAPGFTSTLNGHPYTVDNDLQGNVAAGNKTLYFGDFNRGYVVRQVRGASLTRLDERYAEKLQVAFFAYARFDAAIQDENAYAALVQASAA